MIQTKKAKEIALDIYEAAGEQHKQVNYLHLHTFATTEGEAYAHEHIIVLLETLGQNIIRYNYDDKLKLRDYFMSFLPDRRQIETLKHITVHEVEKYYNRFIPEDLN